MTPEILADLRGSLAQWMRHALDHAFTVIEDDGATVSTWGRPYETYGMSGIVPADVHSHDVGGSLVRLICCLADSIKVERPGGALVLRRPDGVLADAACVGGHALRVRLQVVAHPVTLKEARARQAAAAA